MDKIRVAIAEDNDLLAGSIQEKLEFFADEIDFRYRAANSRELLDMLQNDQHVDTILMDIEMPEMDGIMGTQLVRQKYPQIKVIMLTVFDDEERIFQSIQAGANGYLLKDENPQTILKSIKMIMTGGAPMSPTIAAKSLNLLRNPGLLLETETEKFNLTSRQIDVLVQLSQGLDYHKIASNLYISPATVRKHIENIYEKLHVHNKIQAINTAQKHRLI